MDLLPWTRYWIPLGEQFHTDHDGFLIDPTSEFWTYASMQVKTMDQLESARCIILLGDPGIGKSTEWKRAVLQKSANPHLVDIDLDIVRDQSLFDKKVFERIQTDASAPDDPWYIYLDSVDTGFQGILPYFIEELSRHRAEGVYCRIACRSAFWQPEWTDQFRQMFWSDCVDVVELLPLRRSDVFAAAKEYSMDAEQFIDAVIKRQIAPLANRPVTLLKFLLPLYEKNASFPASLVKLYEDGCINLCAEEYKNMAGRSEGHIEPGQRLDIASYIAAIGLLSDRRMVDASYATSQEGAGILTLSELCRDVRLLDGTHADISKQAVRDTLDTGLFTKMGEYMGWAHSTFAEFLGARYLKDLPLPQIKDILRHPHGGFVPQLHGLAAWLANLSEEVREFVLEIEPEVLMLADLPSFESTVRERLVEALLTAYDRSELPAYISHVERHFHKLEHPSLADQLGQIIADKNRAEVVRLEAIHMASRCGLQALGGLVVDIALDAKETHALRAAAAHATLDIGDIDARRHLRPLAEGLVGDDADDDLRGYALQAMWPDCLTADELFSLLTKEKDPHYIGGYAIFSYSDLVHGVGPDDFIPALRWVVQNPEGDRYDLSSMRDLADQIMCAAWDHLRDSEMIEHFARAVAARHAVFCNAVSHLHTEEFCAKLSQDPERRHSVVRAMIPFCAHSEHGGDHLLLSLFPNQEPWIVPADFDWLFSLFRDYDQEAEQRLIAKIIRRCLDWNDAEHVDRIIVESKAIPAVSEEFSENLNAVKLDSPTADAARKRYHDDIERAAKLERTQRERERKLPSIEQLLDTFKERDLEIWYRVWLVLDSESPHRLSLRVDITESSGWSNSDELTRARIIKAAERYVMDFDPKSDTWFGKNSWPAHALAGYAALHLLRKTKPDLLLQFSEAVWKRWIPIIVSLPPSFLREHIEDHFALVETAKKADAGLVARLTLRLVEMDLARSPLIIDEAQIRICWCEEVRQGLLTLIKNAELPPRATGQLLKVLLEKGDIEAKNWALSRLSTPLPVRPKERMRCVEIAMALLDQGAIEQWNLIWTAMHSNRLFEQLLVRGMAAHFAYGGKFMKDLTINELAEFYLWMVREFPYESDPKVRKFGTITARENLKRLRDSLLNLIANSGSPDAPAALKTIEQSLPQRPWLRLRRVEAMMRTRSATWQPMSPQQVRAMFSDARRRFVQTGDQLLEVIMDSLNRLQTELRDRDLPAACDLWSTWREKNSTRHRPKEEEAISDYVARWLRTDIARQAIIIGREVQLRRPTGSAKGQETDIKVDAVSTESAPKPITITAVIEVKGCWNNSLLKAMKDQLHDEYMCKNKIQSGLYLVGWFLCDSWDENDYRKKACRKNLDLDKLRTRLCQDAERLSISPVRVLACVLDCRL